MTGALYLLGKFHFLLTAAERRRALVLLGLMVVGMALETVCTGLVLPVVALMTQQDLTASFPQLDGLLVWLGRPARSDLILGSMLALVAIYLVKNLYLAYLAWRQARFAYDVQAHVSERLFAGYLRQPYSFHLQRNSAQLIRNTTREVALLTDAILNSLQVATELLVLAGIAILLLAIEPLGALLAVLVLGGAAAVFYRATRQRMAHWGERRQLHEGLRIQHLQQGLGGAKDVKLLGREQEFLTQYATHNVKSARLGELQVTVPQLSRLWLELLAVIGLATLVLTMLAQGKSPASIAPTLALFAAAAFRLMPSANRILAALQMLRYCLASVNVLYDELKLAESLPRPPQRSSEAGAFRSEIDLREVSYTYAGAAAPALQGLNVRVRKGECVGFVGPSGAGKSTLVDVVLGLLPPRGGQVTVDGRDIQADVRGWQDQIGYVPQAIYLSDDSLRRNIAFGLADHEIDDAAVERALRAAQLDELVVGLPQGTSSFVGERGVRLSGGQRQRIGIARALYHDPAVLVLDEATSALDAATERGVMQSVRALQGRKTILIVAHRLSTVENCDRLYQLEGGRIAAEGKPGEILRLAQAV
jgi:ABC-type multidrug transport system fused ATPase/permease subunit